MLEIIIHESLLHQFAYNNFYVSLLLQEAPFILMYLYLIILHQLHQLSLVYALLGNWAVSLT